jgi:hypothetical protein
LNHWDHECTKPKTSDIKQAQAHAASLEDKEAAAQNAYDNLCDEMLDSTTETEDLMDFSSESESEQDFHKAPKSHTATISSTEPLAGSQESQGSLGGCYGSWHDCHNHKKTLISLNQEFHTCDIGLAKFGSMDNYILNFVSFSSFPLSFGF